MMAERFNGPYSIRYLTEEECIRHFLCDNDTWPGIVEPEPGVIYVEADKQSISYLCPCNGTHPDQDCQKYLQTIPIDGSRGWAFTDNNGIPTISPSVFRSPQKNGCHYFITNGQVQWC